MCFRKLEEPENIPVVTPPPLWSPIRTVGVPQTAIRLLNKPHSGAAPLNVALVVGSERVLSAFTPVFGVARLGSDHTECTLMPNVNRCCENFTSNGFKAVTIVALDLPPHKVVQAREGFRPLRSVTSPFHISAANKRESDMTRPLVLQTTQDALFTTLRTLLLKLDRGLTLTKKTWDHQAFPWFTSDCSKSTVGGDGTKSQNISLTKFCYTKVHK